MKKLILAAGICMASFIGVQAQETTAVKSAAAPKEQQVEKIIGKMKTACTLTPEQIAKVKPIVTEFVSAKMENKEKAAGDKDKMKTANQASMKVMNTKLATVLNADQMTKWSAAEKEMQAEMQKKAAATQKK